ncbi:hypothetical protein [Inquilinus sp. Marseille-Q2685]|uniref:hypothetical protein n=1 Tax=Inquilinus sp. Marseille-Q2685 TaxID=2866581 RepID=UPI001CE41BB7|nr:hypothetical protein [Inquilinus sp. Marseille-Q2685]
MFKVLEYAVAAALLLAPAAAMADPWKDESGHGWRGGDYKQEWRDGRCKYERKWDDGEYKEEVKCDGPRRYRPRGYYERPPAYYYERPPVVVAPTPPPGITVTIPFD